MFAKANVRQVHINNEKNQVRNLEKWLVVPENIFRHQMMDWGIQTFNRNWLQTSRERQVQPTSGFSGSTRFFVKASCPINSVAFCIPGSWIFENLDKK
jgi:hypothetical protein